MKVCLLARTLKNRKNIVGVERYSFNIYKELVKKDVKVELLFQSWAKKYGPKPFRSASGLLFYDILSLPFKFPIIPKILLLLSTKVIVLLVAPLARAGSASLKGKMIKLKI